MLLKNSSLNCSSIEFFRPKARSGEKTHGELFKLRVFSTRSTFRASRARSSSFLVRVAPQRVAGHPEAKSGQNLIRNGLLEAILEASWPASKPASQAQPLGRVFSTKRTRGQDRRVFSGQKPVQSKKHRCARSSSSFFVQKHVQSKKLEVIRSDSSFFGQKPVKSKKLRCAR